MGERGGERERDTLIRCVAGCVDSAGEDAAAAHDPVAVRAAEELLLRHLASPDGTDPVVQYTVGVLYLLRAVTPQTDGATPVDSSSELVLALMLLAPFYQNLPGTPDLLPPAVRSALDKIPGFGPPPADPAEHTRAHAVALNDLGMLVMRLGAASGRPVHARAAQALLRGASGRLVPGSAARAMALCNLGYALMLSEPCPEGITEAVTVLRESFGHTPSGDPNYARCANGLGLSLLAASATAQDRAMLSEGAGMLRIAANAVPDGMPDLPQMLSDLGFALTSHVVSAERGTAGDPGLAAEAAEAAEVLARAAALVPAGAPQRPQVLLRLAGALIAAGRPGEVAGLLAGNEALFPPGSEQFAAASQVLLRAALRQASLEREIDLARPAARDFGKLSDPAMKDVRNVLSDMMGLIGMDGGAGRSTNAGVMKIAAELLDTDTDDPFQMLRFLARAREVQNRRFADLQAGERERAQRDYLASLTEEKNHGSLALLAPLDPAGTAIIGEMTALCERLLRELEPASREHAMITWCGRSLKLVKTIRAPDRSPQDRAEAMLQEVNELIQRDFPRITGIPAGSLTLHAAFSHLSSSPFQVLALIAKSALQMRSRIKGLAPGTPEHDEARAVLAIRLFGIGGITHDETAVAEARGIARNFVATAWPPPPALVSVWCQHEWTQLTSFSPEDPADGAGQSQHPLTRLASRNAARALAGHDAAGALETLEDGRAWMLSTAIDTRGDLETLRAADADAHDRLVAIQDEIARSRDDQLLAGRFATEEERTEGFRLMDEGERLVADLSQRPGFARFLMRARLGIADLRPAAADGPVITVNIHPRRCDALILTPHDDHPVTVPLTGLTASDLAKKAEAFRAAITELTTRPERQATAFSDVFGWLWDVLAKPVLDALGIRQPPLPGMPWPRVWWSPTGPLNAFPLHAAGVHGQPGASVLDRAVSSYTPTIRALLRSRARAAHAVEAHARAGRRGRQVLAVAMPETAGHSPLTHTTAEAEAAASDSGHRLIGRQATREAVLTALPGSSITHFACHAISNPDDPIASHLLLHDGSLDLGNIARLRLDGAELAYLSACGTSRSSTRLADEALHLASAFQLAGYSQTVATTWEVGDEFAATAAAEFYQHIAPALTACGPLPAAAALHATVRALRDSPDAAPWAWSALVHAGA